MAESEAPGAPVDRPQVTGSIGLVLVVAIALVALVVFLLLRRQGPGRALHPRGARDARRNRRLRAVRGRGRHPAARRARRAQRHDQGDHRQRLGWDRGRRFLGPRALRQSGLSRDHPGREPGGRAAGRAAVHGRSGRFGSDLSARPGGARGQSSFRGDPLRGQARRTGALAALPRAAARARGQALEARDLGRVGRDARARAPGKRLHRAAARHRLSRSRARRLLLVRCRRPASST